MTLRKAHGHAAELGATVVVEVLPPDEQPMGVPVADDGPIERRPDGTVTPAGAHLLGRRGAAVTNRKKRYACLLADQLGMTEVADELRPYVEAAADFARVELAHLAATAGGGQCGPGVCSMVRSAALALASSRYLYAQGSAGDPKLLAAAARLATESRQHLLGAHELATRQAQARAAAAPPASLADVLLPSTTKGANDDG